MEAIGLRSDLREFLAQDAEANARTPEDIVNELVERYRRERQREKLEKEIAAYTAMHDELKRKHLGQWVAVHEGKLADHDEDRAALYRRVRARFGRTAVLLREVTEAAEEDIWIRTPSTGRIAE